LVTAIKGNQPAEWYFGQAEQSKLYYFMQFCDIKGAAASTNRGHYGRDQSVNVEKGNQWGTGSKKNLTCTGQWP
jgi:hypothetical protein